MSTRRLDLRGLAAVARLDVAEVLRSRWLVLCVAVYAVLAVVFVLVGLRDSSVFGFTGSGRVLVAMTHALLVLLPLMALMATGQVVNNARADGTLELLLSQPIRRSHYLIGVTLVRYAVVLLPLVVLMIAVALYGSLLHSQAIPWAFVVRCLLVSASLLWAFTGLGLFVSCRVRSQARAVIHLLVLWVAGVALLDFALAGLMLQWRLEPRVVFLLAGLNPVQAARMALLSAAQPELSSLGPVGFWISTRIGASTLVGLGLTWPFVVGTASWLAALATFRKQDAP